MADNSPQPVIHEGMATATVQGVEFVDASQVPEVYANHVVPAITSFDVTLHFGSILGIAGGQAKVARRVSIVLTPEVAKLLNMQLSMGLASYEKNVRPIPDLLGHYQFTSIN